MSPQDQLDGLYFFYFDEEDDLMKIEDEEDFSGALKSDV